MSSSSKPLDKFFQGAKRKTVATVTNASIAKQKTNKEKKCQAGKTIRDKLGEMNDEERAAYLDDLTKKEFKNMLSVLCEIYHNMSEEEANQYCVPDDMYDDMKKFYETKFQCEYNAVGALPRTTAASGTGGNQRIEVRLSEWAPSLPKATDEKEFKSRRNKLLLAKATKTCLANKVDGESVRLYVGGVGATNTDYFLTTRGNGFIGMDINHLIPYLKPKLPPVEKLQAEGVSSVRAELIIKNSDFAALKANPPTTLRSTNKLTNARNVLVGQVNAKTSGCPDILKLISVIAYEVRYQDPTHPNQCSAWRQMQDLQRWGFEIPAPTLQGIDYSYQDTCKWRLEREQKTDYEIDGLVEYAEDYDVKLDKYDNGGFQGPPVPVSDDEAKLITQRNGDDCPMPELAFAIKLSSEYMKLRGKRTKVLFIKWQITRHGRLHPVVHVEPVIIDGKTLSHPTGKTAKRMVENKVAAGAEVTVVFGGGVIADIVEFNAPSPSGTCDLPTDVEYEWNKSGEHIFLKDIENNEAVKIKRLQFFFENLKCKDVGDETIEQLARHYGNDLGKILTCTTDELLKLDGFQMTKANNTVNAIQDCIRNVSIVKIMDSSSMFQEGFGPSRLGDIFHAHPDLLDWQVTDNVKHLLVERLQKIRGLNKLAVQFIDQLPRFQDWLRRHPQIQPIELQVGTGGDDDVEANDSQNGGGPPTKRQAVHIGMFQLPKFVAFSGFRNEIWENMIKGQGGKIQNSVNASTEVVVVKQLGSGSAKEVAGAKAGILMSMADFKSRYELP